MNNRRKGTLAIVLALSILAGCSGGSGGSTQQGGNAPANNTSSSAAARVDRKKLIFADCGWDSIQFHSAVAGYIAETVFGYENWEILNGSTPVMHEGLLKGEIDVHMEVWTDNIPAYAPDLEGGKFHELGVNFDDNYQGFYVPRYVIEGDPGRGIAPMAPDLKTVEDLKKYPELFPDEENPGRSRVYGAIPGWAVDTIMYNKYLHYGLDEQYEYFRPGSDAAMNAAFTSAYTKGAAMVGYYWEPTWLMGMYDFVLLEDAPYDPDLFPEGACELPAMRVTICASNSFYEKDPEFCEFLKHYRTSSALTSEVLAYIQDTGVNHTEAAKWFLREHDELVDAFLTEEQAAVLREALGK